jgi:hypothetical protein
MSFRRRLTLAAASAVMAVLGGCVQSESQEFAVTGAPPSPPGTPFRTTDPNVNDVQARAYCAGGYEKLGEQTVATEDGTIQEWRVRCTPHDMLDAFPFF